MHIFIIVLAFAMTALGTAIVIEFLSVLSLGLMLLFFTCKCAILLVKEKRQRQNPRNHQELSRVQSFQTETVKHA